MALESTLSLDTLVRDINDHHQCVLDGLCVTFKHAAACGNMLATAKEQVAHGQWGRWVEENLSFGPRQARKYIVFAKRAATLPQDDGPKRLQAWQEITHPERQREPEEPAGQIGTQGSDLEEPEAKPNRHPGSDLSPANQPEAAENAGSPANGSEADSIEHENAQSTRPRLTAADYAPKDGEGRTIPEHLRDVFAQTEKFKRFASVASHSLKGNVREAAQAHPVAWSRFNENAFRAAIQNAHDLLTLSAPYIVCTYCGGEDSKECRGCKGTGFLTRAEARCAPEELRR